MVKVREMRVRAPRWMFGNMGGAVRRMSRRDIPTGHFCQAFAPLINEGELRFLR
jgi:hypothetical protein